MDKYIGKRLDGRYEIIELIGVGGMANVYRALDRLENTDVAVKILREEFLGNEDFVRRFKNESKAISLLSHPNIVKVYDVNFSDTVQCIVMELIDGITLKEYIDRQGQLGWRDAVFFTEQILKALQHAHDRGIVHRDIKPQNIMLLANGTIKVMDFGIARFSRSETRTITDKAIGSVHYISPEQAKGDTTDAKADIYSTGVMLYEMLAGKLPFESDSPVSVAIKQISDIPQSLREVDDTIPPALEEITFKAMVKDPVKRYQSAAQMLRDIEEFKRNPSIKFAYKYTSSEAPTRYVESSKSVKPQPPAPMSRKKKKRRGLAFLLVSFGITLACMIGTAILVYMVFNGVFEETVDVKVPDFVGLNVNDVKKDAKYAFKWEIEEVFDSNFGKGVVIAQTPTENMIIKETGTIKLKVSKGTEMVAVPDVKGYSMKDAIKRLQDKRLVVSLVLVADDSVKEGYAYKTSPDTGTTIEAGQVVTLYINPTAGGSGMVSYMPNVVGMTLVDARVVLSYNRIRVKEIIYEKSNEERGRIIEQDIRPGVLVEFSQSVTLKVSEGPSEQPFSWTAKLPYSVGGNNHYNMRAILNGEQICSETIKNGPKSYSFDLMGSGEATLAIYVDGQIIYELKFNFDDGSYKLKVDNSASFQMSKPAEVDKGNLGTLIGKAKGLLDLPDETATLSPGDHYVPSSSRPALQSAHDAAKTVYNNSGASQSDVDAAVAALEAAMSGLPMTAS